MKFGDQPGNVQAYPQVRLFLFFLRSHRDHRIEHPVSHFGWQRGAGIGDLDNSMVSQCMAVDCNWLIWIGKFDGIGNKLIEHLGNVFRHTIGKDRAGFHIQIKLLVRVGQLVAFHAAVNDSI